MSAPAELGDFLVTTQEGADGNVRTHVERADPRIKVSGEIMWHIARDEMPGIRLDPSMDVGVGVFGDVVGRLLRIEADNRTVVYRVTEQAFVADYFVAEWPD
jgi:hypothetical protein